MNIFTYHFKRWWMDESSPRYLRDFLQMTWLGLQIARLYEQGASKRRIGLYLARWLGWATMMAGANGFAVVCPDSTLKTHELWIGACTSEKNWEDNLECKCGGTGRNHYENNKKHFYANIGMFLPDYNTYPDDPATFYGSNGNFNTKIPINILTGTCVTVATSNNMHTVKLDNNQSCTISFSVTSEGFVYKYAGTLSRQDNSYKTTNATVVFIPSIANTAENQAVDDNRTIKPFSATSLVYNNDQEGIEITITADPNNHGVLSKTSITGNASNVQSTLRAIKFTPTPNRISVGDTESTTFKLTVKGGNEVIVDNTTTVVTTSVNTAPTITGAGITGTVEVGKTLTASPTGYDDVDVGSDTQGTHAYQWHTGTNTSCAGKSNISGATSSTFAITNSNIGKFLCVTLTPKDQHGLAGTPKTGTTSSAVPKLDQTITNFTPPTSKTYGNSTFNLTATSGASSNDIVFASTTTSVCTVSTNTVTIKSAGTCTLTANEATDAIYNAAPTVTKNVTIAKADITATAVNASRAYGANNPTFTATYTGLVNSDTAPSTLPDLETTANATTSVGTDTTISCTATTDTNYNTTTCNNGTLTITKANTTTTITSDNADPSVINQAITVAVSVASATTGTPTGTVAIDDGNSNTCDVTLNSGIGNCTLTPADGNTTLTATYAGDTNFNSSNDTEAHASLAAGISVDVSDGISLTEAGTTDTYTLTAITAPAKAITVTITADAQTQVSNDGSTFGATTTVNISDLTAKTITVKAIDDSDIEGDDTAQITHAVTAGDSGNYSTSLSISNVDASITDNDAGVIITQSSGSTSVTEGGATDSFDVVLNTQPTQDITITITPDTKTTVDPETLTFDGTNPWNTAQTITVTAVDDNAVEGSHSSTIGLSAASVADGDDGDGDDYEGASFVVDGTEATNLSVSITDNDSPAPKPTPTPSTGGSTGPVPTTTANQPIVQFAGDGSGSVTASERSSGKFSCHSSETCPTKIPIGWYKFEPTADDYSKFVKWSGNNCKNGEYTTTFGGTCIAEFKLLPPPPDQVDVTPAEPKVPDVTQPTLPEPTTPVITEPTAPTTPVITEPVKPVETNYVGFSDQAYNTAENAGSVNITINRIGTTGEVSVDLLSSDDSGKADTHYHPIDKTLFWANGDNTEITVPVKIIDNSETDGDKNVTLSLGNADNAKLRLDTAILTIVDDDEKPPVVVKPEPTEPEPSPTVPVITEEPVIEPTPVVPSDAKPAVNFALPAIPALGPSSSCTTGCNANGKTISDLGISEVKEGGQIVNVVLDAPLVNKGRLSNITVAPEGQVSGGVVTGFTNNEGQMADFEFVGATLSGANEAGEVVGTLAGKVLNNSKVGGFEDVQLAPKAQIAGGILAKRISGDNEKPATLAKLHIKAKSFVSNVIVEENVTYGDGVIFTNVEFRTQVVRKVTLKGRINGTRFKETYTRVESVTIRANSHLANLDIGANVKFEAGVTLGENVSFSVHQRYLETHRLVALPNLNPLAAIDKQGRKISTWARLQGGARFGAVGNRVERYRKKVTLKRSKQKKVDILGNVLTDVRHIGLKADILVVAAHTPLGASSPSFYMLDSNGTRLPWDMDMSSLVPFRADVTLAPVVPVSIWNKPLDILGDVQVYFGYRLRESGNLVYSLENVVGMTFTE